MVWSAHALSACYDQRPVRRPPLASPPPLAAAGNPTCVDALGAESTLCTGSGGYTDGGGTASGGGACAGSSCTQDECCTGPATPTCSAYISANADLCSATASNAHASANRCADATCLATECCTDGVMSRSLARSLRACLAAAPASSHVPNRAACPPPPPQLRGARRGAAPPPPRSRPPRPLGDLVDGLVCACPLRLLRPTPRPPSAPRLAAAPRSRREPDVRGCARRRVDAVHWLWRLHGRRRDRVRRRRVRRQQLHSRRVLYWPSDTDVQRLYQRQRGPLQCHREQRPRQRESVCRRHVFGYRVLH